MKDNLFEILLNLFERSLSQLQKSHESVDKDPLSQLNEEDILATDEQPLFIKSAQTGSNRVVTFEEQMKLTKASYQFLMRMKQWNIINVDLFESIMNQLQFSDSRIVTLEETKWTIRSNLVTILSEEQLAFLDLVLYQKEDELTVH